MLILLISNGRISSYLVLFDILYRLPLILAYAITIYNAQVVGLFYPRS